ncbi:MAG: hypothetical protein ABIS01_07085 [Ferruginibacter sp.]
MTIKIILPCNLVILVTPVGQMIIQLDGECILIDFQLNIKQAIVDKQSIVVNAHY